MSNLSLTFKKQTKVLIATFTDRRNAKEFKRLLSIGCVFNSLNSNKGRIIETNKGLFSLYAID